jgi:acyl-CoA thioester hydrolase
MRITHDPALKHPDAYPHVRRLDIVFADMDIQGHVNNVAIARFFEEARSSLHREIRAIVPDGFAGMVLASIQIDYLVEVTYPGVVDLAIGIAEIGSTSFQQTGALFQNGECAALSTAISVRVSRNGRRPVPITDAERHALEQFRLPAQVVRASARHSVP